MTADDVVEMIQFLAANGIKVYVDGGWGVDALVGQQTRPHNDLDIAMEHQDVSLLRELLAERGYREIARDDSWECNFVLANSSGRQLDVHSYTFDDEGHNIFGVPYPAASLTGSGTINGYSVNCIAPQWMLKFHTGYELDEGDYHDVLVLCQHFGFDLPDEYKKFQK